MVGPNHPLPSLSITVADVFTATCWWRDTGGVAIDVFADPDLVVRQAGLIEPDAISALMEWLGWRAGGNTGRPHDDKNSDFVHGFVFALLATWAATNRFDAEMAEETREVERVVLRRCPRCQMIDGLPEDGGVTRPTCAGSRVLGTAHESVEMERIVAMYMGGGEGKGDRQRGAAQDPGGSACSSK